MNPALRRPAVLIGFFLVATLGYILTAWWMPRLDADATFAATVDRKQAIKIASQVAREQGLDTDLWRTWVCGSADDVLYRHLERHPGTEKDWLDSVHSMKRLMVIFQNRTTEEMMLINLRHDGRLIGYQRASLAGPAVPDLGEEAARAIAAGALNARFGHEVRSLFEASSSEAQPLAFGTVRTFSWLRRLTQTPGVSARAEIKVVGDGVITERLTVEVDDEAIEDLQATMGGNAVALIVTFVLIPLFGGFAAYRFVRRLREREVPVLSCVVVGGVIFVLLTAGTLASGDEWIKGLVTDGLDEGAFIFAFIGFILPLYGLFFAVLGLLAAIFWGGGEGDIREAYPERLVSLDALLRGRLLSRNLNRSLVVGAGCAGVTLLLLWFVRMPWWSGGIVGMLNGELIASRSAFGAVILGPALISLVFSLAGLLVPLPFLLRLTRCPDRALRWCMVISIASAALFAALASPGNLFVPRLLMGAIGAAGVVLAFVLLDVVAALASGFLLAMWSDTCILLWQPAPSFHGAGLLAIVAAATVVTIAAVLALRGRELTADEVRPTYASNIVERLALHAEVSMADEAKKRLFLENPPRIPGASLELEVREGDSIGGYCDCFPQADGRLVLAVTAITATGSSWALVATLLQGYLITDARRWRDPEIIVKKLEERLARDLDEVPVSLAIVIYDPAARRARISVMGEVRVSRYHVNALGDPTQQKRVPVESEASCTVELANRDSLIVEAGFVCDAEPSSSAALRVGEVEP